MGLSLSEKKILCEHVRLNSMKYWRLKYLHTKLVKKIGTHHKNSTLKGYAEV